MSTLTHREHTINKRKAMTIFILDLLTKGIADKRLEYAGFVP